MKKRNLCLSLTALTLTLMCGQKLHAVTVTTGNLGTLSGNSTTTGTLSNQGIALEEMFSLSSASSLTIYTNSYGGGPSIAGSTTTSGGFMPSLVLYSASGNFVAGETFPSPLGKIDPATGLNGDAYLKSANLAAGTYILALSDFLVQQSPTATNLSDGFVNFGGGTSFIDVAGNIRSGNYSLNLSATSLSTPPPTATPEPATFFLLMPAAMVGLVAVLRRRRLSVL